MISVSNLSKTEGRSHFLERNVILIAYLLMKCNETFAVRVMKCAEHDKNKNF